MLKPKDHLKRWLLKYKLFCQRRHRCKWFNLIFCFQVLLDKLIPEETYCHLADSPGGLCEMFWQSRRGVCFDGNPTRNRGMPSERGRRQKVTNSHSLGTCLFFQQQQQNDCLFFGCQGRDVLMDEELGQNYMKHSPSAEFNFHLGSKSYSKHRKRLNPPNLDVHGYINHKQQLVTTIP